MSVFIEKQPDAAELEQRIEEAHTRQQQSERHLAAAQEAVQLAEHELAKFIDEIIREEQRAGEAIAKSLGMKAKDLDSAMIFEVDERRRLRDLNRIALAARAALATAQEQSRVARDAHAQARDAEQLGLAMAEGKNE